MSNKSEIADILNKFELSEREKANLQNLFDFTNYLFDNEDNLTKTFNLIKEARTKLEERIQEMFESDLSGDPLEERLEGEEEEGSLND